MLDWIIERGKEGSTWRGIVALLTAAGVHFSPELQEAIISVGLGLIGVIGVPGVIGGKCTVSYN